MSTKQNDSQKKLPLLTLLLLLGLAILLTACGKSAKKAPAGEPAAPAAIVDGPALSLVQPAAGQPLELWIENASGIYALEVQLHFDPAQLQIVDADSAADGIQVRPGQAPSPDFVAANSADNNAGLVTYAVTQLGDRAGFNGRGLVASIDWQGAFDPATLSFGEVTVVDEAGQAVGVALLPPAE